MRGAMPTCRDVTALVTDYVEGRMGAWDRLRFQLHLGMCRHCREYVRQMKVTARLLGAAPPSPPPPEVEAELIERFRDWKRQP
ncbi:MAG: zf-HC2 domain-containing protein [Acidobacteriota bacterium]